MTIAIIGAGISGLTAAYTLRTDAVVFEKSRGVTGRMATRWYDRPAGRVYVDHGAQHLKDDGNVLRRLIHSELPSTDLHLHDAPVWTFDSHCVVREGSADHNSVPKWSYAHGLTSLGRLLVERGNITVRTQTRLDRIHMIDAHRYRLYDIDGHDLGDYSNVLFTVPAPQAADIIAGSILPMPQKSQIESTLRAALYRRCITVVLGFDRPLQPRPYGALLNSDRQHPVVWIGLEHSKAGHVPEGYSVLVAQMSSQYSMEKWDYPIEEIIAHVAGMTSEIMGEDVTAPDWTDIQKWRYSQPDVLAHPNRLNHQIPGLWFAGDYLRGGRIHLAAECGYEIAQQMQHNVLQFPVLQSTPNDHESASD
jgi:renalase